MALSIKISSKLILFTREIAFESRWKAESSGMTRQWHGHVSRGTDYDNGESPASGVPKSQLGELVKPVKHQLIQKNFVKKFKLGDLQSDQIQDSFWDF